MPDFDFDFETDFISKTYKENTKKALREFMNDTYGGNPLEVVLRSHLYFENALENALRSILERPDIILNERFTFSNKLALVHSLGIIPDDFNSVIKYFNKNIRNRFAHDLKFEIKDEHVDQLINRFNKKVKQYYMNASEILKDIALPVSDLMRKLICCTYAIWANIRIYHKLHFLIPLEEEIALLQSIMEFNQNADDDALYGFLIERQIKLVQQLKKFSMRY